MLVVFQGDMILKCSIKHQYTPFLIEAGSRGGTPVRNRRGCSSEILNLTPNGDQSGRGLSKF